jgi:RNA polymerase sigma factor (sigma-70 family)
MNEELQELNHLVALMQEGETSCFTEFYERTKKFIYFSIVKIVDDYTIAEDILQETYLYFLDHLSQIKSDASPIGFLLISAKHLSIDYLRKRKREVSVDEIPSAYFLEDEKPKGILEAVQRLLNKEEAAIVLLHTNEEMTFKEIGRYLGKPLGTVQWKYNEAMKKLRKEITPDAYR